MSDITALTLGLERVLRVMKSAHCKNLNMVVWEEDISSVEAAVAALSILAQEPAGQSATSNMAGVAEQSGAGAPETSVRCGAPATLAQEPAGQSEAKADLISSIQLAVDMISAHIEEHHDFDYPPHDVPVELQQLRDIQHHLLGSLIDEHGNDIAVPAGSASPGVTAEPVAWRVRNDFGHWYITANKALADIWRDIEELEVEPLYSHPAVKVSGDAAPPCPHPWATQDSIGVPCCQACGAPWAKVLEERGSRDCEVCGGDCAGANPPVSSCPQLDRATSVSGDAAVTKMYEALNAANLEYSAFSCNGVNLFGDRKSIDAAQSAFNSHGQIDYLKTNLRHWRDECGKLHVRLKGGDAAEMRERAAKVADALAAKQRVTNEKYPDHAKAYQSWRTAVFLYEKVATDIRALPLTQEGRS